MQIIHSDDQVDISEVFSRPRLVPRCAAFHLIGGQSFDWKDDSEMDLAGVNGRATVWAHVNLYEPKVLMLSPPCTLYSQLMQLWAGNRWGRQGIKAGGLKLADFCPSAPSLPITKGNMTGTSFWNIQMAPVPGKKIVWLHLAPSQEFSFPVSISADLGCVARTPKNLSGKGHDWSTTSLKSMLSSTTSSVFVKSPTDRSRVLREASRFHRSVKRILPKWLTPCFLASRPQLVYRLWTEGFIAPGPKEKMMLLPCRTRFRSS